jgi:hypothetical protein
MNSQATPEFWERFAALPAEVQQLARKSFALWKQNPRHPSLRFRPHGNGRWSVRVGDHYRALAHCDGETFIWTWIGSHEKYNKL